MSEEKETVYTAFEEGESNYCRAARFVETKSYTIGEYGLSSYKQTRKVVTYLEPTQRELAIIEYFNEKIRQLESKKATTK